MRTFQLISLLTLTVFVFGVFLIPSQTHAAAPTNGLVGYWAFEEGSGTTAGDSSGNGNNGTLTNGPTWTAGKVGSGAVGFDGSNDAIDIGSPSIFSVSQVTVSAWAKDTRASWATSNYQNIFVRGKMIKM